MYMYIMQYVWDVFYPSYNSPTLYLHTKYLTSSTIGFQAYVPNVLPLIKHHTMFSIWRRFYLWYMRISICLSLSLFLSLSLSLSLFLSLSISLSLSLSLSLSIYIYMYKLTYSYTLYMRLAYWSFDVTLWSAMFCNKCLGGNVPLCGATLCHTATWQTAVCNANMICYVLMLSLPFGISFLWQSAPVCKVYLYLKWLVAFV